MKRSLRSLAVLFWVGLLLLASTSVVLAQGEGGTAGQDALWSMLAPIVAIATSTERLVEMYWNRYEQPGVWPNKKGVANPKESAYVLFKMRRSYWLGTAIAFIAVGLTDARFFRLLGLDVLFANMELFHWGIGGIFDHFTVGSAIDWALTAGVIGWGGTELVHNIIEGLVKGRNLWKETEQVRAGERQFTETQLFYEYVLPHLEQLGIPATTFFQITGWLREANVPLDEFVSATLNHTQEAFFARLEATPQGARAAAALRNLLKREEIAPDNLIQISNLLQTVAPQMAERFN